MKLTIQERQIRLKNNESAQKVHFFAFSFRYCRILAACDSNFAPSNEKWRILSNVKQLKS